MKSLRTVVLPLIAIHLSAWIGVFLFVFGFLVMLFTHNGSPVPAWFAWGVLTLLLLADNSIWGLLVFLLMPIYWGLLTWFTTFVKSLSRLIFCLSLFFVLHLLVPYWVAFHAKDSYIKKDFLAQLSQHCPFLITEMIVVGIANCYLFSLPFVFYWLSRRKP